MNKHAPKPELEMTGEGFMKTPEIVAALMIAAAIDTATQRLCAELGALMLAVKDKGLDS
jgi:hypothetical protein